MIDWLVNSLLVPVMAMSKEQIFKCICLCVMSWTITVPFAILGKSIDKAYEKKEDSVLWSILGLIIGIFVLFLEIVSLGSTAVSVAGLCRVLIFGE